ncbi:UTRA domain-containing protein [Mesorhizobium sp. NBSH29]|nr:UTRA domain-containing protein [Mesorhizobium sp. NBSH29]
MHQQVCEMLIREIAAGRRADGEKLPPEREMAQSLGIAVGTLRKALGELEAKGLLERVQGSGNYVRHRPEVDSVYALFRLELIEGGGLPTAKVISVARMAKPVDLPEFGQHQEGHRIRRLRHLGGRPAAVEEIWLDASHVDQLSAKDLSDSLYLYYRKVLRLWIARAEDRLGVATVPGWAPDAFGLAAGASAGFIERIGWTQDGASIEFSRTWFDHTVARYVARLR